MIDKGDSDGRERTAEITDQPDSARWRGYSYAGFGGDGIFHWDGILPASLGFEHRGIILMVVGFLLMLPFLFFILSWVRSRTEAQVLK